MANKMTLKDYFAEVRVLCEDAGREDLVKFVDGRIEQIDKKNASKSDRQTKAQTENAKYAEMVCEVLGNATEPTSVTDICKALPPVEALPNGWSTQKVTSLLTPMVKDGSVVKTVSKGKSLYALA